MNTNLTTIRRSIAFVLVSAAVTFVLCPPAPSQAEEHKKHGKPNRLSKSSSPYLLQHAYNPVDWYEWGDEAFKRAKAEDKPIFLSIGYAACHWCHVMAHESFEDEEIAKILKENYIAIKVDREERPDVDEVYMAATVAATGRGGWPMSVFMTPDKEPFLCGTYFPPKARGSRPGFRELLLETAEQWHRGNRQLLLNKGDLFVRRVLQKKITAPGTSIINREKLSENVGRLVGTFDPVRGGRRGRGTKFPPTMAMELMLREYATQPEVSDPKLLELVEVTLREMAKGGIYDHIGGGICRYSTDPRWFAPHFEKMLYDQATVSGIYLSAYQLTHNELFARTARSILDYCIADMQSPQGGFYSSRDADSEGEEGKFYVWRRDEIAKLLSPEDTELFCAYYNVKPGGNWHGGQNILYISVSDDAFATQHGMNEDGWRERLGRMKKTLFEARSKRTQPGLDDKILAEWNGLLISRLARASRILNEPRYRVAATRAADFILRDMIKDGRLHRVHRNGKTYNHGYSTDYTNVIEALITLYETTFERKWLTAAEQLSETLIKHFYDRDEHGFFYTAHDAEELFLRSKNPRDSVVPSGNSVAVLNFLRLGVLLGNDQFKFYAEASMRNMNRFLSRGELERMQWAVLFYHEHPKEVAIIGDPNDANTQALIDEVYRNYLPNKVVASCTPEKAKSEDALPLLKRKTLVKGKPGAYVCRDSVCGLPVNNPADLAKKLDEVTPQPVSP